MPGIPGVLLLAIETTLEWNLDPLTVRFVNLLKSEKSKLPGKPGIVYSVNGLPSGKVSLTTP